MKQVMTTFYKAHMLNRWSSPCVAAGAAGLIFAASYAQAQETSHSDACGCTGCSSISEASGDGTGVEEFNIGSGWSTTASGTRVSQGDSATLTWSIVPDGTSVIAAFPSRGELDSPSNLVASLDGVYGAGSGSDLTQRAWFDEFNESMNRWAEVSGLTMIYEPNDDGVTNNQPLRTGGAGVLGTRGDIRIGGHTNVGNLGYAAGPNNGDVTLNTDAGFYTDTSDDSIRLRNVLMHEVGHSIGISHFTSSDSIGLLEPFLTTAVRGPQHEDIRAVQRLYGDAWEGNGGNDTTGTATSMGTFTGAPATFAIGTDGDDSTTLVDISETDFISIDGTSDLDVFSFTLSGITDYDLSILLNPRGTTFLEGPVDGEIEINTKAIVDLQLELLNSAGTIITTTDVNGVGFGEALNAVLNPGDYFVRVGSAAGAIDDIQLYQLDVSASLVPEPTSFAMLGLGGLLLLRRRRR